MRRFLEIIGFELQRVSHAERWVSAGGGIVGILAVFLGSQLVPDTPAGLLVVASMGASAVLLFAVPHGPLSQPWAVFGGHLVSAVVGVSVALVGLDPAIAGPLAVGLAILAMHYARCIHPPGGASALSAVLAGPLVDEVGYGYVLTPVMLNACILLGSAFVYNWFFPWRRYPVALALRRKRLPEPGSERYIPHESLVYALSQIDSMLDISEQELLLIYELATRHQEAHRGLPPEAIAPGRFYSNGLYGEDWEVRLVLDWDESRPLPERQLTWRAVAGRHRRQQGVMAVAEFARWARHEVYRDDENWRRVQTVTETEAGESETGR